MLIPHILKDNSTDSPPLPGSSSGDPVLPRTALACLLALVGIFGWAVEALAQDLATDKAALVALYNATDGANWTNNTNWLSSKPVGDWYGVTVSNGRVTELDLHGNQLTGSIPTQLADLGSLQVLRLYNNQLRESIPIELGNLSSLQYLNFHTNKLTGNIPTQLANLSNLESLWLHNNQLTGNIPTQLGNLSSLQSLRLDNNQLTGNIPNQLGNLSSLQVLVLSENTLTGTIPAQLSSLASLRGLALSDNQLRGNIPNQLGNLSSLQALWLHNNQLTGTLPTSFTGLGALEEFYFYLNPDLCAQDATAIRTWLDGVNDVQGPDCSPTVRLSVAPSSLFEGSGVTPITVTAERTAVSSDTSVDLRVGGSAAADLDYRLAGALSFTIPANSTSSSTTLSVTPLADMLVENNENIIIEAVVGNKTEGSVTLPLIDPGGCAAADRAALEALYNATGGPNWTNNTNWLSNKPLSEWHGVTVDSNGCVTEVQLNNNQLTGMIPTGLGNLANLRDLRLFNNQLTGTIPTEIGDLTSLQRLTLADNLLTGTIPTELGNLANLQQLGLHRNQLEGTIPAELGSLTNLQTLSLNSNQLTGLLPQSFTGLGTLEIFHFDQNSGLCAQADAAIRTWLNGVDDVRGPDCPLAQSDKTAKGFHLLPHIADGGGWLSTLLVTNVAQSASACTLQLYGLGVDRFEHVGTVQASGSTATFNLQGAGAYLTWPTKNQQRNVASGYATLDCTEPVVAQVVFASIGSTGRPTGMATVFSSQAGTVFQFPVLTGEATLGFAIANDSNAAADCRIVLEDPQRRNQGRAVFAVPSKSNWAGQLLDRLISPIPTTFDGGTATVSCDQPVAMIGLHFELRPDRSIITFNTLPPAVVDPFSGSFDETAKRFHILPHIADGDGWRSTLLVTNVAEATSQCRMQLYGLSISRFQFVDTVQVSGSTATFDLPGAGAYLTWPTRDQLALASGYATLDCTEPVVAQVVFASIGSTGRPTGMATVFSSQAGTVFQFPVLTGEATLGFAIANDSHAAADCRIVLEDPERRNQGRAVFAVPSKSNWAGRLLDRLISPIPTTFDGGTATVSCDQPVAILGLHFELRPDRNIITFSTLPPAILESTQSPQQAALETLFHAGGRPSWSNSANWLSQAPLGQSFAVGTVGKERRRRLELNRNELSGTILSEPGTLSDLRRLDFGGNQLGFVPTQG